MFFESLNKSLNNCEKGNWDALPKEDIEQLVNYQINAYYQHEEEMTERESNKADKLIHELIDCAKKINPAIQLEDFE